MVMTPNETPEVDINPGLPGILDVTPPEVVEEDAPVEAEQAEETTEETPAPEVVAAPAEEVATQATQAESPPQISPEQQREEIKRQMEMEELGQRRIQEEEQKRRQAMVQQAKQYEQNLLDEGLLPDQARKQTRQMVSYENRIQEQEKKATQLMQFAEGRNIAALQLGMKHGLIPKQVVDDISVLLRTNNPEAMNFEAQRMAELRNTRAEIAKLKQGQVQPQTFDNGQGSSEATSNESRLLDAYLAGDRSEAAVRAARDLTFGS
jgi:hypothetical protein